MDSQAFVVGTEVEARYKGRHEWFRAMIVASRRYNTSFDLRYSHNLKITMSSQYARYCQLWRDEIYGDLFSSGFIEAIRTYYFY